jgi:hypothetical protein
MGKADKAVKVAQGISIVISLIVGILLMTGILHF